MHDTTVKLLSGLHRILYRTTGGIIGDRLVDNDMLLLTTTGRRTGRSHTVPLLFLRDSDRLVIIASYGGRPHHPEWYHNLIATPEATVQIEREVFNVHAQPMTEQERTDWWPRIVDAYGDYAAYQERTNREIPVVWLDRGQSES